MHGTESFLRGEDPYSFVPLTLPAHVTILATRYVQVQSHTAAMDVHPFEHGARGLIPCTQQPKFGPSQMFPAVRWSQHGITHRSALCSHA